MKMTIDTQKLQTMVTKSAAGASQNKLLPITGLVDIQLAAGVLTLMTTDSANTLYVKSNDVVGDDFHAVVPIEIFAKLIAKTTSSSIILQVEGSVLKVKGNGDYSIAMCTDEDGVVEFPSYKFKKSKEPEIFKLTDIKNILSINKAAVCRTIDSPFLCSYHLSDMIISTDETVICFNNRKLVEDTILVSSEMMDLLGLFMQEDIALYRDKGYFLFETPNVVLHGPEHEGKDKFPADNVKRFLSMDFPHMCKLPKLLLQAVIDRLSLFIEPYDKNGAYFTFTKDGVRINSKRSSSVETISYAGSENFAPFVCCVDIPILQEQINSIQDEIVELWYGHPAAIKLISSKGKITQVIALLQDENLGENSGN